jgi:hypothetical protein
VSAALATALPATAMPAALMKLLRVSIVVP